MLKLACIDQQRVGFFSPARPRRNDCELSRRKKKSGPTTLDDDENQVRRFRVRGEERNGSSFKLKNVLRGAWKTEKRIAGNAQQP